MEKRSTAAAIEQLKNNRALPLYFLIGKEKFFQDLFIHAAIENIFPERASRDLNLHILYGSENTLSELLSACLSYPMLSDRKLVIVRDFDKMKLTDPDALQKYVDNPQQSTTLVLASAEKGRQKIYDHISKHAQTVDCAPIPEYKVTDWLSAHCRSYGRSITPQAAQFLVNHIGPNLLGLDQEINKIISYKNDDSAIRIEDLEATTGISREANIFALQKALSRRQLSISLNITSHLRETGVDISAINAILFAFFRKTVQVAYLKQRGQQRREIASQLKLREFQLKEMYECTSHFNLSQLRGIIGLLHQSDRAAKTSAASKEGAAQMLCYQICRI